MVSGHTGHKLGQSDARIIQEIHFQPGGKVELILHWVFRYYEKEKSN